MAIYTIQVKRGQSSSWEMLDPVLEPGEPGYEMDTGRLKVGNGLASWNNLPYVGENDVINASTHYDFPSVGRVNALYKAETEKKIYQWNSDKLSYEVVGGTNEDFLDIQIIHGGNANDYPT